jgi:hypothetical protein
VLSAVWLVLHYIELSQNFESSLYLPTVYSIVFVIFFLLGEFIIIPFIYNNSHESRTIHFSRKGGWYGYRSKNKYSISCYSKVKGYTFKRWRSKLFNFSATYDPTFGISFCMVYLVGNFLKCSFTCNKRDIIWTSELGVITNLVEAHMLLGGCTRTAEDSTNAPPRWPFTYCY